MVDLDLTLEINDPNGFTSWNSTIEQSYSEGCFGTASDKWMDIGLVSDGVF